MASMGAVQSAIGALPADLKRALTTIFEYVLKNWRFGRPSDRAPSENFQGSFVEGTTHGTTNTEFSIEHGRGTAPYLAIPVRNLQAVGSKVVDLTVTRAADTRRVYFKSTVTSAPITLYLEG